MRRIFASIIFICLTTLVVRAQTATDFSGEWKLNTGKSELGRLPSPDAMLRVEQSSSTITVSAIAGDSNLPKSIFYPLDGRTEKRKSGDISYSTQTKWEGAALLANTLVSGGGKNYTLMERFKLSANGATLTIRRTVVDSHGESEATLVYESPAAARPSLTQQQTPLRESSGRPTLVAATTPRARIEDDFVVTSGTRVLLHLRNAVDTKHSAAGDRVYLETSYPVYVNQQLVIPQGSYVMGTVVEAERAR